MSRLDEINGAIPGRPQKGSCPEGSSSSIVSPDSFAGQVISFGRVLKDNGFSVSIPSVLGALGAISRIGVENPQDLRTAFAATFMTRVEEKGIFDRLFNEFWLNRNVISVATTTDSGTPDNDVPPSTLSEADPGRELAETAIESSQEEQVQQSVPYVIYSPVEVLREKDFKEIPEGQDRRMIQLLKEILSPMMRKVRVKKKPASSGPFIDFRRVLRKNIRYGGDVCELPRLKPKLKIKKLVFLCDVSGSMNPYLRFMLSFIKALQALPTKVETFVFATRLSRITKLLAHARFSHAIDEIGHTVQDWSGGTRIGSCFQHFISVHGSAMLRPSSVVLIHSDGWDRGDPELLESAMAKLHRKAYRVIWINPLLGGTEYEPTCRGMRTALPYVDSFLPGHSIAALERVAGTIRGLF